MKIPRWAFPAAAALTASGLVITACGQENAGNKENTAGTQKQAQAAPSAPPTPTPAAEPTTLEVARIARLGKIVTDGDGRTLYRFDNDTASPSASTCAEACAKAWPPVWAGQTQTEVEGVQQSLVGKVKRPDGRWQVTLAGWPLYRYVKDQSPGDVNGQGVGGTWYAASPTGKKATPAQNANDDPPKRGIVIRARNDPRLGRILTDGEGRTLYRFDEDDDRPPTTSCFGDCKKAWPPVVFRGWKDVKLEGVSKKTVDFIERKDDGECQITIDGWPVYYYAKDEQPGDTNGQGVGGVWWATTPTGDRATAIGSPPGNGNGNGRGNGYGRGNGNGNGGYASGGGY
ncbi:SCO0930 family lipoprotein [Spirillospora sp. NPDC048819]|uniref:SCO0930 family lipoprotein n=1 Tax=Spirillospora sp. NPDC048819 TaxID=3155268 RepID=UPI0033F70682